MKIKVETKPIEEPFLECPKCRNRILYLKYTGQSSNMTYEDINKCLIHAKKFDECFTCFISDNFDRITRQEVKEEWCRLLVPLIYKPNASYLFFCRCGYHSSNPLNFNRVKLKGTYYDGKKGIQLEREIFMLREELYKLQEEKKIVNNNLIKANQTIYNLINN